MSQQYTKGKKKADVFNDYEGFVEKFKPKKTTDDCYTPPEIYTAVLEWVDAKLFPLDGHRIIRPFYPGGDYEAQEYQPGDVVIDNPPFSIITKIVSFYVEHGIKFFLFAPALTLFSGPRPGVTYICANANITYENGAKVPTSFVTNMEGKNRIMVAGDLCLKLQRISSHLKQTKATRKLIYPDEITTSARLGKIATRGVSFNVPMNECEVVSKLDNARGTIFGGGYILSHRAAAEKAAAEKIDTEYIQLSEREMEIVRRLSSNE